MLLFFFIINRLLELFCLLFFMIFSSNLFSFLLLIFIINIISLYYYLHKKYNLFNFSPLSLKPFYLKGNLSNYFLNKVEFLFLIYLSLLKCFFFFYKLKNFNKLKGSFQFLEHLELSFLSNYFILLGLDGISILLSILTILVIQICIYYIIFNIKIKLKDKLLNTVLLYNIELFLIGSFFSLDLLSFFFFFESSLIPIFLVIVFYGYRNRKIKACFYLLIYTLFGSIFLLFAICLVYAEIGSLNFILLNYYSFNPLKEKVIWLCFFLAFITKIPLAPFHIWLPEAHVEAPTVGSVILASLLLKLGTYGLLRFNLILVDSSLYFNPLVNLLCLISIIYCSLIALTQVDIKKIIAYSSISHMGLIVLGIFSFNPLGFKGSILLMLSHGFVSSVLFFLSGFLYDTFNTRDITYLGGLTKVMPITSVFFFIFSLLNCGIPPSLSFISEILVYLGVFYSNPFLCFLILFSIVSTIFYSIFLYSRLFNGSLKNIGFLKDLDFNNFNLYFFFLFWSSFFGFFPNIILSYLHSSVTFNLINYTNYLCT